ncbi:MAG: hypothetical protein IT446_14845 [Phycisphaerales bacterium]|nr:hypothetical protein [Phycisphaerales bacterium]
MKCLQCEYRQRNCHGACACTVSGRDITDHADKGDCPKGFFNTPSATIKLAHGVVGIAKAVAGIDRADGETISKRIDLCKACEHAKLAGGLLRKCELCGCAVRLKVRVKGESCPAGKW